MWFMAVTLLTCGQIVDNPSNKGEMNPNKIKFYPKDLVYIKSMPKSTEISSIEFKNFGINPTILKKSSFLKALDYYRTRILDPNNKLDDKLLSGYSYSPWYNVEFITKKGNYKISLFLGGLGFMTMPNGKRGAILFNFYDFNTTIKEETRLLKKNKTKYQRYVTKEDSLFLRHTNLLKNRPQLHAYPRLDLRTLEAPLAYYYIRFKSSKNKSRYREYLYAILESKDSQNRLNFVLYIKQNYFDIISEVNWDNLILVSANTIWANNYISSADLKVPNEKRKHGLYYYRNKNDYPNTFSDQVINHWLDSLNHKNKEKVYIYLNKLYSNGVSYLRDADFELLYKLKPVETQNKLSNFLYDDKEKPNAYTLYLLAHFNTQNISVANKIVLARAKCDTENCNHKYANTAIYFMNPELGKKEVVSFLEKEIQEKSAIEDNYFNVKKVLKNYVTDLCKSSEDISILIDYLISDNLYVSDDITKDVLETIYNTSPKYFEKVLLTLREYKEKAGKEIKALEIAEKVKVLIDKKTKFNK